MGQSDRQALLVRSEVRQLRWQAPTPGARRQIRLTSIRSKISWSRENCKSVDSGSSCDPELRLKLGVEFAPERVGPLTDRSVRPRFQTPSGATPPAIAQNVTLDSFR